MATNIWGRSHALLLLGVMVFVGLPGPAWAQARLAATGSVSGGGTLGEMVNNSLGSGLTDDLRANAVAGDLLRNAVTTAVIDETLQSVQEVLNSATGPAEVERAAAQIAELLKINAGMATDLVEDALGGNLLGGSLRSALNDIMAETVGAGIDDLLGGKSSADLMRIVSGLLGGLHGAATSPAALLAALNDLGIPLSSLGLTEDHLNALLGLAVPVCPAVGAMMPCENLSWSLTPEQQATAITVSSQAQLLQALNTVRATGGTILLAGGNYGTFNLNNYNPSGTVTIGSADPGNKAVINQLRVENSSNMLIGNLTFQYEGRAGPDGQTAALTLSKTDNIHVTGNMFSGYTIQPGQYTPTASATDRMHEIPLDGFGTGFGFRTEFSDNTTLSGNTFDNLSWGSVNSHSNNVRIIGNTYTRMTVDAMNGGGGTNILYQGNYVTQMSTPPGMAHDDALQYRMLSGGVTNLQIIGNYIDAGPKQGFFLGNECVDGSSIAGLSTGGSCDPSKGIYHGVRIEGNTIIGKQAHGITVGTGENIEVLNNTVANACGEAYNSSKQISVSDLSNNVTIAGNSSVRVHAGDNDNNYFASTPKGSGWNIRANTTGIPCMIPETLAQAPGCAAAAGSTETAAAPSPEAVAVAQ